jgi:hypothetical protein
MKIDFTTELTDMEGQPMRWADHREACSQIVGEAARQQIITAEQLIKIHELMGADESVPPLTLGRVTISSLLAPVKDESQEDKMRGFELMQKIHNRQKPITVSDADVTFIKKAIGNSSFVKLVMGQCWNLLAGRKAFELEADEEDEKPQDDKVE